MSKSEPLPEGTVIMADYQYAGRGQQGSRWTSEAGVNLTFSILLNPTFLTAEKQFMLNIAVCQGIRDALSLSIVEGIKVKWPNDLYFGDKKVCGILIENTVFGNRLKSSIIGIGINVNQRNFDELGSFKASSLSEILQADVDLVKLLAQICKCIEVEYLKLKAGMDQGQHLNYIQNLYRFGEWANYKQGDRIFEGRIVDVTKSGLLVVESEGIERRYGFKEIEFLNKN